jgi:hypothetical protein
MQRGTRQLIQELLQQAISAMSLFALHSLQTLSGSSKGRVAHLKG